jgi:hypothetical protein
MVGVIRLTLSGSNQPHRRSPVGARCG